MPEVTHPSLIEKGMFRTHRLSAAERAYVAQHISKGKLHVNEEPPGDGANPVACFDALDIFSYYPHLHEHAAERLTSSLAYENVKAQRAKDNGGYVGLSDIGVGDGIGQSREERLFDFELYRPGELGGGGDWASAFRTTSAPVVQDPEKVKGSRRVPCPWCDDSYSGKKALQQMSMHVGRKHPEHKANWQVERQKYQDDPLKGVTEGVAGTAPAKGDEASV